MVWYGVLCDALHPPREYGAPCLLVEPGSLTYQAEVTAGDYPANYVEETEELPCVRQLDSLLMERVEGVEWREGSTTSEPLHGPGEEVVVVRSTRCFPGLQCRVPDPAPTSSPPFATINPTSNPNADSLKLYPVCTVPEEATTSTTTATEASSNQQAPPPLDCADKPCLCQRMDYKLVFVFLFVHFAPPGRGLTPWTARGTSGTPPAPPQASLLRCSSGSPGAPPARPTTSELLLLLLLLPTTRWCSDPHGGRLFGEFAEDEVEAGACSCSRCALVWLWFPLPQEAVGAGGGACHPGRAGGGAGGHLPPLHICRQLRGAPVRRRKLLVCWGDRSGNRSKSPDQDSKTSKCLETISKKPPSGDVRSTVVPESLVELLPCFPLEEAGTPDQVGRPQLHPLHPAGELWEPVPAEVRGAGGGGGEEPGSARRPRGQLAPRHHLRLRLRRQLCAQVGWEGKLWKP